MNVELPGNVFNYLILRTIIGVIALSLPFVVWWAANIDYPGVGIPTSISITYHLGARDIFVGSLFIVSAFLFAYNGHYYEQHPNSQRKQSLLSKIAGACAAIVALFPSSCNGQWIFDTTGQNIETCSQAPLLGFLSIGMVHTTAAVTLFLILTRFCLYYFQLNTKGKGGMKGRRSIIYQICGWTMVAAMLVGAFDVVIEFFWQQEDSVSKVMFAVELVCLVAFGIAWLVAGKQIPILATSLERKGLE